MIHWRREQELRRLVAHEEWISQPVHRLFPTEEDDTKRIEVTCRGCGKVFLTPLHRGGIPKKWCTSECKLRARRRAYKAAPRQPRAK